MKLCPRLASFGIFDKDAGYTEAKRIKLCMTCPLGYCVYDKRGAISGEEIKILLGVKSTPDWKRLP